MDDIVVAGVIVGNGQHAGQGILIIVRKDAGVFVVGGIHATGHGMPLTVK